MRRGIGKLLIGTFGPNHGSSNACCSSAFNKRKDAIPFVLDKTFKAAAVWLSKSANGADTRNVAEFAKESDQL